MFKLFIFRPNVSSLRRYMCTIPSGPKPTGSGDSMSPKYKPNELQKFFLVWTKKYKSKQDIPAFVSPEIIDRSRSEARIKISNVLICLTALASFGAILAGKAAAKRGESVHQMNLDWHKKYQDQYKKDHEQETKE